jgi:hypothetical protein
MRSLWRPLGLLTLAMVVAFPAQANPTAPTSAAAATTTTTVCDRAVCESVTGAGSTVQSVKASAYPFGTACGHFAMTITTPQSRTVTNSPTICAAQLAYLFPVHRTFPAGTTIAMAFTSPLTPGRPVVRLPLR